MDFEGLQTNAGNVTLGEAVDNFYDGGFGSLGTGPGPDMDIQFVPGSATVINLTDLGASAHSGVNAIANFLGSGNVLFTSVATPPELYRWVSFYYVTPTDTVTISLYDGPNGTGNLIGSAVLPSTGPGVNWTFFRLRTDPGLFITSVKMHQTVTGSVLFDDIVVSAPVPASLPLVLVGLLGLAVPMRNRFAHRNAQAVFTA